MTEDTVQESEHYGRATAALVDRVFADGAERAVLLMRHSAREYDREIHDLLNPLTAHGRRLCVNLGRELRKDLHVKAYASPPARCMETAQLVVDAHARHGGQSGRTRAVEALGVFYSLDQIKMWKGMRESAGLADYIGKWFAGDVAKDSMMPPDIAVSMILRVLHAKLVAPGAPRQLDLCVTHDMTLLTVRHHLGLESVDGPNVEYLDGLVLYAAGDGLFMASHHGGVVNVTL